MGVMCESAGGASLLHGVTMHAEATARASDCSDMHTGNFEHIIADALGLPASSLRKEFSQHVLRKIVRRAIQFVASPVPPLSVPDSAPLSTVDLVSSIALQADAIARATDCSSSPF